jgi:Anti-sigma-K factor rskA
MEQVDLTAESKPASAAATRPPIMERVGLWQAVAGMALAVGLGSAMVAIEIATELAHRTHAMNGRIARLNDSVRTLRRTESATQRKLGSARLQASEGELIGRILFAPDLKITRLIGMPGAATGARGVIALSESAGAAMVGVTGLKPSDDGNVYRIWYLPRRGIARWVDDFLVGEDGKATVAIELPQISSKGVIAITLESQDYAESPSGPVALQSPPPFEGRARHR